MPNISISEAAQILVKVLEQEGGALGNRKAHDLLVKEANRNVGQEYYERIKDHLIAEGIVRRGRGRGGSIVLMGDSETPSAMTRFDNSSNEGAPSPPTQIKILNSEERINSLQGSLEFIPGLLVRKDGRNRRSVTLLFGNDADKLFAAWDDSEQTFIIEYRVEKDKPDHSILVFEIFKKIARQKGDASHDRRGAQLLAGRAVASVNDLCRSLVPLLDEVCLGNAPGNLQLGTGQPPLAIGPSQLALDDRYYEEVATLIQICVEKNLKWPMVNWRSALCFDAVDRMIVIGESQRAKEKPYREHIVPVNLIKKHAEILILEGAPTSVVADFIKHHLWVALIHEDEARQLDEPFERGGKGLKDSMPRNWIWGDDPMERLRAAGIKLIMSKPTPSAWNPWRKPIRKRDKLMQLLFCDSQE